MAGTEEIRVKLERILDRISRSIIAKLLFIVYLNVCYSYRSIQRYYDLKLEPRISKNCRNHKCSIHPGGQCPAELLSAHQPKWMLLFNKYFAYYQLISTTYVAFVLLRKLLPLERLLDPLLKPSIPTNCFIPGRVPVSTPLFEGGLTVVLCCLHLLWRGMRLGYQLPLQLDMVGFIMISDEEVERESLNIERQIDESRSPIESCCDLYAKQIRSIMRLPADKRQADKLKQTIRPNRTPQAYRQLHRELTLIFLPTVLFLIPVMIVGAILSFWYLLSGRKYLERYPGCNPTLERLAKSSQVPDWSLNLSWHRLFSLPFDFADNQVIWIDSLAVFVFTIPLYFMLSEDLFIYCRHVHASLRKLRGLSAAKKHDDNQSAQNSSEELTSLQLDSLTGRFNQLGLYLHQKATGEGSNCGFREATLGRLEIPVSGCAQKFNAVGSASHQFGALDYRCQQLLLDFFNQLEAVDEFTSSYITTSICVWLFSFAFMLYHSAISGERLAPMIRFYQFLLFLTMSVMARLSLRIHRTSTRSYSLICSIMANDRSQHWQKFEEILEYFTARKRATFTFFHGRPFLATSFLTMIGWTFSISILIENLLTQFGRFGGTVEDKQLGGNFACHRVCLDGRRS